jgi:hypothetical protein
MAPRHQDCVRVAVGYTLTMTRHEWKELVRIAREHGHDYDNKSERNLVKRLLERDGTGILASTAPETQ